MKENKNVHRGVAHLPSNERDVTTPVMGVGKLSRIHRTYRKERSSRRSRSRDRFSLFRKALQFFLIFIGIALTGVVSWMIYSQIKNKSTHTAGTTLTQDTFAIAHPHPPECVKIVQEFLKTSTESDVKKTARLVHMDAPEALKLLRQCLDKHGEVARVEWAGASEINGLSMEMVMVSYKSGYYRIANLLPNEAQDWLVDLESFVAYNDRPWEQITGSGSCRARVRVIAAQDFYFNGVFSDEQEWTCLALTSPDNEKRLLGYVKNQSALYDAFKEIFKSNNPAPVLIEISRDAGMEPLQFEIKKVIAQGWVESDVEFQSRFRETKQTALAPDNAGADQ